MKMNEYMERTEQVVLHTYNRFTVVFEKGEGVHLYDTEGKEYLDFGAGIAVFALGYHYACLLYTSPSPRDFVGSRMPSSA